jgi:AcrR family transcriptional regulator
MVRSRGANTQTDDDKRDVAAGRPRDPAVDDAILQTAFELFMAHGPAGVNFDQIAKRSGVSRAAIYRRWKSKERLLVAALRRSRRPLVETPREIAHMSTAELLDFLAATFVDTLTRPRFRIFAARMIGCIPDYPELASAYQKNFVDPFWKGIVTALQFARSAGELRHLADPEILLALLSGALTQRLLMRTGMPDASQEKKWVSRLMRQMGLQVAAPRRRSS